MNDKLLEPEVAARGAEIRRKVLGDSYVNKSYAVDEFSRPKVETLGIRMEQDLGTPGSLAQDAQRRQSVDADSAQSTARIEAACERRAQ